MCVEVNKLCRKNMAILLTSPGPERQGPQPLAVPLHTGRGAQ